MTEQRLDPVHPFNVHPTILQNFIHTALFDSSHLGSHISHVKRKGERPVAMTKKTVWSATLRQKIRRVRLKYQPLQWQLLHHIQQVLSVRVGDERCEAHHTVGVLI